MTVQDMIDLLSKQPRKAIIISSNEEITQVRKAWFDSSRQMVYDIKHHDKILDEAVVLE